MVADGIDPIAARREARRPVTSITFEKVASGLLDELEKGWKSPKQRPQWEASLTQHAPKIWKADVSAIDTEMVLEALKPIWSTKRETAQRLRGRIERVLSAAKVQGHRSGENPARWDDHLSELLSREKQAKGHFAAMPYKDLPAFVSLLKTKSSASAKALLFTILAAGRSGEGRGAAWSEISGSVWTVPAERMKAKEEHKVPITPDMEDILNRTPRDLRNGLIFPGPTGAVLSDVSVTKVIRLAGIPDATVHGFRSTFRDWAGDCTNFARETIEEALAHRVGDATEQAYRRSRSFEKRRLLMTAWADFCMGRAGQVVPFNARENG